MFPQIRNLFYRIELSQLVHQIFTDWGGGRVDECVGVSSWVDGGLGVWKCPCMTACTCTQIHTHVKHGKHDTHEAGHFLISIHVSFNIYVHAVHVGVPPTPRPGGPK